MEHFCHLSMHSRYSFLHGTMDVEVICRKAAHDGQRYAALTDVNTLAGAVAFVEACSAHGLRPVLGVDLRVPGTGRLLLLARNARGYARLCALTSHLHLATAAPPGPPPLHEDAPEADEPAPSLRARIRHPLEARPFDLLPALRGLSEDVLLLTEDERLLRALAPDAAGWLFALALTRPGAARHRHLFDLAESLHVPVVAAHDVFFLTPNDYAVFRTLRAVATCTTTAFLPEEEAGRADHYWISRAQLLERYVSPAPVFTIARVLDEIDLSLDLHTTKPASFFALTQPRTGRARPYADSQRRLADLAWQAFHERYPDAASEAGIRGGARVEKELKIIEHLRFADYFLIAHDVVAYARRRGYHYLGRGSGASSFVAFLLGITQVNPLTLDLYFERFLNPERHSPPDFDLDFSWRDRDDVLAYVFERFGTAHVAMLCTHVTLRGRGALRQIGRTLGLTEQALSAYTRRLPSRLFDTPEDLLQHHPEAAALDFGDETLRALLEAARLLYGTPVHYGVHAGGLILTSEPVTTYTALTRTPKGLPVTQLDMHGIEAWGIMKLDVLSTRGLGTFTETLDLVRREEPAIDARIRDARVVLGDAGVRRCLREAETIGIFYTESPGMRSLLRKLRVETFAGLTAASSIIRPGVSESGMMQAYVERHRAARGLGGAVRAAPSATDPELQALLQESYGVMIYQEDVLKVAHLWAGLSLAEADLLRRAMSGTLRSTQHLQALEARFFEGCRARGRDPRTARAVWRQIASFAGYAFCKSHSASYAKLSMQQAYLKAHYPAAFMVSVLRNGGGYYHPQVYVFEAARLGIPTLPPCLLQSDREDALVPCRGRTAIRLGLGRIRGLPDAAVRRILAARRHGAFCSVEDFLTRTGLGPEETELLIDAGAFDVLDGDEAPPGAGRRRRAWELHLLLGRKRTWKAGTPPLFPTASTDEVLAELPPLPPYRPLEILHAEMRHLGLPVTYHPVDFIASEGTDGTPSLIQSPALARCRGRRVRLHGWLMAAKRITTRRLRPMLFLTLYDGGPELFEAVLFPDAYARCAPHLDGCGPYVLEGVPAVEYGVPYLNVERLAPHPDPCFAFDSPTPWVHDAGSLPPS